MVFVIMTAKTSDIPTDLTRKETQVEVGGVSKPSDLSSDREKEVSWKEIHRAALKVKATLPNQEDRKILFPWVGKH